VSDVVHQLDRHSPGEFVLRTGWLPISAVGLAALVGALAGVAPQLALAGVLGLVFVVITLISLPMGVVLFTVLVFLEGIPQLASTVSVVKLAGVALTLAWAFHLLRLHGRVPLLLTRHPVFGYAMLLFFAWTLASSLWATDEGRAVYTAFQVFQAVLLMMIVFTAISSHQHFRWIVWAFIAGAVLSTLAGLAGATPADDPEVSGAPVRLAGATGDPNELAAALVPALVLSLFAQAVTRAPLARWLLMSSTVLMAIGILLTESRGGMVAAGVALVSTMLLSGPVRARAMTGGLIVAAGGVLYYALLAPPEALARITGFSSGSGRTNLWAVAIDAFQQHPVTGVGAGNFTVIEQVFAVGNVSLDRTSDVIRNAVVHNSYLHVLAELGVVGFVLFASLLAGALVIGWRAVGRFARSGDRDTEILARGLVIAAIGMFAAYFFLSAQYEKQLYLMLGALTALSALPNRSARVREPPRRRLAEN
jgi:putative inorganic carbon (hco3(-)) transporter